MSKELRELAEFISSLRWDDIPPAVREQALICTLDTVGVAVGALENEQLKNVTRAYVEAAGEKKAASLWGRGQKLPVATAAFLNGMAAHTLELDDVHTTSKTHIGTVVVPAAWAAAESLGRSGMDLLLAVICGYEVMSRLGMGFGVTSHRNRGWHVTSTAGTFGAAAAAAKLFGLDAAQTLAAFGLAGTQSFGTWAFLADSATNKVLHPARAASEGLESALLAKAGMRGSEFILDAADGGIFAMMSDKWSLEPVAKDLGSRWEILFMDNKPYPCCRSTHCTIDAALALKGEYGVSADDVQSAELRTYEVGWKQCGVSAGSLKPTTAIEAKFSTPYTIACALLRDGVSLADFSPEAINDEAVQSLLARIRVVPDERFSSVYPDHWGCELSVRCRDGRTLVKQVDDASGSVANPMRREQVIAKARGLMAHTVSNAGEIVDSVLKLCEGGIPRL